MFPESLKCVFVGDSDIGKTAIVQRYFFDDFGPEYVPTAKQDYSDERWLTNSHTGQLHHVALRVCDTGGLNVLDRLRPLCYSDADILIICFSVVVPSTYKSVMTRWMPEIKRHTATKNLSLILVGTQIDLRSNFKVLLNLAEDGLTPVSECKGFKLAKSIGAKCYIECSAATRRNIKNVFDTSLLWSLRRYNGSISPSSPLSDPGQPSPGFSFKVNASSPTAKASARTASSKSRLQTTSQAIIVGLTGGGVKSTPKATKKSTVRGRKVSKLKQMLLLSCFA